MNSAKPRRWRLKTSYHKGVWAAGTGRAMGTSKENKLQELIHSLLSRPRIARIVLAYIVVGAAIGFLQSFNTLWSGFVHHRRLGVAITKNKDLYVQTGVPLSLHFLLFLEAGENSTVDDAEVNVHVRDSEGRTDYFAAVYQGTVTPGRLLLSHTQSEVAEEIPITFFSPGQFTINVVVKSRRSSLEGRDSVVADVHGFDFGPLVRRDPLPVVAAYVGRPFSPAPSSPDEFNVALVDDLSDDLISGNIWIARLSANEFVTPPYMVLLSVHDESTAPRSEKCLVKQKGSDDCALSVDPYSQTFVLSRGSSVFQLGNRMFRLITESPNTLSISPVESECAPLRVTESLTRDPVHLVSPNDFGINDRMSVQSDLLHGDIELRLIEPSPQLFWYDSYGINMRFTQGSMSVSKLCALSPSSLRFPTGVELDFDNKWILGGDFPFAFPGAPSRKNEDERRIYVRCVLENDAPAVEFEVCAPKM